MDMPFELSLVQKGRVFSIPMGSQWEEDDVGEGLIELVENSSIYVEFRSENPDARFYMEGLEMISEHLVREDEEGRPFLPPTKDRILLCSYDSFPLSPDDYLLQVIIEEKIFYGRIRIVPGRMSTEQMQAMRNELEEELKGLSFDMYSHTLLGKKEVDQIGLQWFYQLMEKQAPTLFSALQEFAAFPRFQMGKEYRWQKIEKAGKMDTRSFRSLLTSPRKDYAYLPVQVIRYDLPENRWVKFMMGLFHKYLFLFLDQMEIRKKGLESLILELSAFGSSSELRRKQQKLAEVQGMLDLVHPMIHLISYIQTLPWFKEIPMGERPPIPSVIMEDGRYRQIFNVYRAILKKESSSLRWKSTGKLYEIWSYLLVIRTLCGAQMGFQKVLGQLGEGDNGIPELASGTRFIVEKGDIRIAITFDEPIPRQSGESEALTKPLYTTGSHNRPDARLDVFCKGIFCGSLLIDFKYRNSFSVWDEQLILSHQRSREMAQLIAYGFNPRSIYLYGNGQYRFVDPVHEVWVFYPKRVRSHGEVSFPDYKLRLLEVTPGTENSRLVEPLRKAIKQMTEKAQKISGLW